MRCLSSPFIITECSRRITPTRFTSMPASSMHSRWPAWMKSYLSSTLPPGIHHPLFLDSFTAKNFPSPFLQIMSENLLLKEVVLPMMPENFLWSESSLPLWKTALYSSFAIFNFIWDVWFRGHEADPRSPWNVLRQPVWEHLQPRGWFLQI